MLNEVRLEKILRKHLVKNGWNLKNTLRKNGEHGWDIVTKFHKTKRKALFIECKGDSNSRHKNQKIHSSFWTVIGQVMSRMDIQGNSQNKGRIYAIAIPIKWKTVFQKKAQKMEYAWNFLKLKIFLVSYDGKVKEKTHRQFLR